MMQRGARGHRHFDGKDDGHVGEEVDEEDSGVWEHQEASCSEVALSDHEWRYGRRRGMNMGYTAFGGRCRG